MHLTGENGPIETLDDITAQWREVMYKGKKGWIFDSMTTTDPQIVTENGGPILTILDVEYKLLKKEEGSLVFHKYCDTKIPILKFYVEGKVIKIYHLTSPIALIYTIAEVNPENDETYILDITGSKYKKIKLTMKTIRNKKHMLILNFGEMDEYYVDEQIAPNYKVVEDNCDKNK
jgi:hypothetical protein